MLEKESFVKFIYNANWNISVKSMSFEEKKKLNPWNPQYETNKWSLQIQNN